MAIETTKEKQSGPAAEHAQPATKKVVVLVEGQRHEDVLEYALATEGETVEEQDKNLRERLRPHWPLVANATISRTEKDGVLTITILKAPAKKGGRASSYERILARLLDAPAAISPVILLDCQMRLLEGQGKLDLATLLEMRPFLAQAVESGKRTARRMEQARRILLLAPAVPGKSRPVGF
jgi:hypothetical protein